MAKRREEIATQKLELFCKENDKKMGEFDEDFIARFTKHWIIERAENNPTFKGYVIKLMIYDIIKIVDRSMHPITIAMKSVIRRTASKTSGVIFRTIKNTITRATPYSVQDIAPLVKALYQSHKVSHQMAATVLLLTMVTGGRTGDILWLNIEDCSVIEEEGKVFFVAELRTSKNNKIPIIHQQLTAESGPNTVLNAITAVQYWCKLTNKGQSGLMFPNKSPNETQNMVRIWNQQAQTSGLDLKLGAHTGRNNVVMNCYRNGVNETSMRTLLGWLANSEMTTRYRGTFLETSRIGAASILTAGGFNQAPTNQETPQQTRSAQSLETTSATTSTIMTPQSTQSAPRTPGIQNIPTR